MRKVAVIGLKGLPALGGTAVVGQNIIQQLKDEYEFSVYSTSSHTKADLTSEGINQIIIKEFPIKKLNIFYYYIASAFHALFKGNYSFIHLHLIDGAYILPLLRLKYKVISTSHGRPHTVGKWNIFVRWFFLLNERIFLKLSNIITSVSLPLIDEYRKYTKREIFYIPNGINHLDYNKLRTFDENNYILFAARRIIECKGAHLLLQALQDMKYKGKIKIIGELDQVQSYREEIMSLSQGLNIDFLGLITDKTLLLEYVKNAHVFIFPSLQEAMSIMLLEVASTSTPLICSDIPANKVIFNTTETTFFESGNVEDLKTKILFVLNNYVEAQEMASKAFESLKDNYTWHKISIKYKELYESFFL